MTRAVACATRRAAGAYIAIQILYRDWKGACDIAVCAHDTACDTASARCDTLATRLGLATIRRRYAPRHGSVRAVTRRYASGLGAVRARPGRNLGHGCAHCALDPVLTQCTVLSYCLDHCS